MLILDSQNVRPCLIQSKKHPVGHAGLEYRGLLFIKARSFPSAQRQEALRLCRSVLDEGRFCILLKEGDRYTLCNQVKSAISPADRANSSSQLQQARSSKHATARATSKQSQRESQNDGRTTSQQPKQQLKNPRLAAA